jgi:hypothetical protein
MVSALRNGENCVTDAASPQRQVGKQRKMGNGANGTGVQGWMAHRIQQDDLLYEKHGRSHEEEHAGEFVAICDDGRVVLGRDELTVATKAIEQFGAGNFALRRIGADFEVHLRPLAL